MAKQKVKFLRGEEWKLIKSFEGKTRFHYAVSNFARIICYKESIGDGYLSKISEYPNGYMGISLLTIKDGKRKQYKLELHKVMAECFLPEPTKDKLFVIHLDYNKNNNSISNLKWMNNSEKNAHSFNHPDKQKKQKQIIEFLPGEKWKLIKSFEGKTRFHYAVSNFARVICFKKTIYDGYLSKISIDSRGFSFIDIRTVNEGKATHYTLFIHRAVAECFLLTLSGRDTIIHLDYNKNNNSASNLKWVSFKEMYAHVFNDPGNKRKTKQTIEFFPGERWRLIESVENFSPIRHYAVSDSGRVMVYEKDMKFGRLLKPRKNSGHSAVSISKMINGQKVAKLLYYHHLIAECFLPPPLPHEKKVVHKNGNKEDNRISNLTWISNKEFKRDYTNCFKSKSRTPSFRIFANEEFRKIKSLESYGFNFHYAISNFERLVSYIKGIEIDGRLLKGAISTAGYKSLKLPTTDKFGNITHHSFLYRRLMAECFLPPPPKGQENLIHKDYNVSNSTPSNLAWLSEKDYLLHINKSPGNIARTTKKPDKGPKLTLTQVKMIKRIILKSKDKLNSKILAKKFNITVGYLRCIKAGRYWAHVSP